MWTQPECWGWKGRWCLSQLLAPVLPLSRPLPCPAYPSPPPTAFALVVLHPHLPSLALRALHP